jgi:hypothetical protein
MKLPIWFLSIMLTSMMGVQAWTLNEVINLKIRVVELNVWMAAYEKKSNLILRDVRNQLRDSSDDTKSYDRSGGD